MKNSIGLLSLVMALVGCAESTKQESQSSIVWSLECEDSEKRGTGYRVQLDEHAAKAVVIGASVNQADAFWFHDEIVIDYLGGLFVIRLEPLSYEVYEQDDEEAQSRGQCRRI